MRVREYMCVHEDIMCVRVYAVFHLEKWTRGGKMILRENLGGPRDCAQRAPSRGVWGHAPQEIFEF